MGDIGGRLAVGADEITDAVGFLDHEPDAFRDGPVLVQFELDEDIAGIELSLGVAAFAVLHLADPLGGDQNPADDGFQSFDLDLAHQRLAHAVFFVARNSQDEKLHGRSLLAPLGPFTQTH